MILRFYWFFFFCSTFDSNVYERVGYTVGIVNLIVVNHEREDAQAHVFDDDAWSRFQFNQYDVLRLRYI